MKKTRHIFERYTIRHGHGPQIRLANGVQRLTIEFQPGYVRIATSSPYSGEVYITRSAWFHLLRRAVPLTRRWEKHRDFDVPQQVHESAEWEAANSRALRQQKKTTAVRQKQRYLRAKERAQKRAAESR